MVRHCPWYTKYIPTVSSFNGQTLPPLWQQHITSAVHHLSYSKSRSRLHQFYMSVKHYGCTDINKTYNLCTERCEDKTIYLSVWQSGHTLLYELYSLSITQTLVYELYSLSITRTHTIVSTYSLPITHTIVQTVQPANTWEWNTLLYKAVRLYLRF